MRNPLENSPNKIAFALGDFIVTANEDGNAHLNSKVIAKVSEHNLQNIRRICKIVNIHDELVSALKLTLESLMPYDRDGKMNTTVIAVCDAIKKAEEE